MDSIQGRALVASPYLTDSNFLRSVVYILRHDEEGAIGLIINRPTPTTIGSLLEQLLDEAVENEMPVYYGGPVEGPLMLLQERSGPVAGMSALYVASDQQCILQICNPLGPQDKSLGRYRVFDGYSGWGAGQLDDEMRCGGWLLWDVEPDQLFSDPDELWQLAIKQIGREILSGGIDPSKIPEDPAYN
ncbi:MAG: YqgE/AlgH family protein [Planctomycetales bacterium]|nr:YqgE/AlgH family protein [Planctomycetales bacterium]